MVCVLGGRLVVKKTSGDYFNCLNSLKILFLGWLLKF